MSSSWSSSSGAMSGMSVSSFRSPCVCKGVNLTRSESPCHEPMNSRSAPRTLKQEAMGAAPDFETYSPHTDDTGKGILRGGLTAISWMLSLSKLSWTSSKCPVFNASNIATSFSQHHTAASNSTSSASALATSATDDAESCTSVSIGLQAVKLD